jgi:5'-nucleotidase
MAYDLEKRLVIGLASSALFDLSQSHQVFLEQGEAAYRDYQLAREHEPLKPGVAFSFIRRLLALNDCRPTIPWWRSCCCRVTIPIPVCGL